MELVDTYLTGLEQVIHALSRAEVDRPPIVRNARHPPSAGRTVQLHAWNASRSATGGCQRATRLHPRWVSCRVAHRRWAEVLLR